MMKKMTALALAAVMALALGACGDKKDSVKYGLVTTSQGIIPESVNADIYAAIQEAATLSEEQCQYYTAEDDTAKGIDAQFKTAADDGTELVFAYGKDLETAVFRAQRSHRKTRYVLVDGYPSKNEGDEVSFRENTTSIGIATQDAGFIAGYGSVRNGYRKLGFIAGTDDDANKRYLSGYVQGAELAATELNLSPGDVKVTAVYAEDDTLTPLRMTDALILYKSGTDVIYAVGENVATSVAKAAQSLSKPFIAGGVDMNNLTSSCIFSTVSIYRAAIEAALNDYDSEEGLPGGQAVYYGAADKAVKIIADYTRLSTFSETDYNNAVRQIMEGTVTVSGDEMTEGTAHVALTVTAPPSGLTAEEVAAAGLSAVSGNSSAQADTGSEASGESESSSEEASSEEGSEEDAENGEEYEEDQASEEEYDEEENAGEEYTGEENTEEQ
ncbi:MAG: BMP family ABC transporter substrate-binding protein [Lachnospiraceae bacterium]|nr:BMP family ABC transporter substrate-binding protein [Lachnospiraceae bacterium]